MLDHHVGRDAAGQGQVSGAETHGYGDGFQEEWLAGVLAVVLLGDQRQIEDLLGGDVPRGQLGDNIVGYLLVAQFYGVCH